MRLLLLLPRDGTYRYRGPMRRTLTYAPLSLSTLAALVPPQLDAEIRLLDEGVEAPLNPEGPGAWDVVGITCGASGAPRAYALARALRARGAYVVLGGPHPSLAPREAAEHADAVVVGCAEGVWPDLLLRWAEGKPRKGVVAGAPGGVAEGFRPRRDLLKRGAYLSVPTVTACRGCDHACSFCSISQAYGRRAWPRKVGDVIDELRGLGGGSALFLDPNLGADREHALELFQALRPLKLAWAGLATAAFALDEALLSAAADSGCRGMLVGFESATQASLDQQGKGFHRAVDNLEAMRRFHGRGIRVLGCWVLGFDGDTAASIRALPGEVERLGIDLPRFAVLTPFPGTRLHADFRSQGRILTDDLSLYDCEHVVFRPSGLDAAELQSLYRDTWRRCYTLPKVFRRSLALKRDRLLTLACGIGFRRLARSVGAGA